MFFRHISTLIGTHGWLINRHSPLQRPQLCPKQRPISKEGQFATLTFNQSLLSKSASAGPPTPGQLPQSVPLVSSSDTDDAAHARKRSVIQRNSKAAARPTPDLEEESRPNLQPLQQIDVEQQLRQDLQREEEWAQQRRKKEEFLRK